MKTTECPACHQQKSIIIDSRLTSDALAKLAKYEDVEEEPDMDEVLRGLYKAKSHAISEYSKKRIQDPGRHTAYHQAGELRRDGLQRIDGEALQAEAGPT